MQRQSEQALDLLTTSDEIVSSIETHGVEVAAILEEKWSTANPPTDSPQVDAANPPDYLGQLLSLRDGLNGSAASLSQADVVHVHQLANLIQLREDRQNQTDDVYNYFSAMRRTLDELHGEGKAFVMAGIEGPTARLTRKLLRQVDLALPRLRSPNLKPQPKVAGITVDTGAMADELEERADTLRATQAEFQRTRRVVQASRKEKNRRIKEHRTNITWSARIVEGYYQLAGETELAERLRPIVTRSSRPSTPPPADESPVPDEPTPPTGTPDDSAPDEPIADEPAPEEETAEDSALRALRTLADIRPAPSTPDA